MYEKLIEALRGEAMIRDAGLASKPAPAWQTSLRDALKGIADRLEGGAPGASDDDEPLTAEWLEAAQPALLPVDSGSDIVIRHRIDSQRVDIISDKSAARLPDVTTRGEYRTLRRMLGVPMREGE